MKTITLKTPPSRYQGILSNTIAHLLEHITTSNFVDKDTWYFEYIIDTEASTYCSYTTISIPDSAQESIFVDMITRPFTEALYHKEWHALQEELSYSDTNFIDMLQNKVGEALYGKDALIITMQQPTFAEVVDYHRQWYTQENMLITDADDHLIACWANFSLAPITGTHWAGEILDCMPNTKVIAFPYRWRKNHRLAYFVYDLLKNYNRYTERYVQGNYFYEEVYLLHHQAHIIVAYAEGCNDNISKSFFEAYKTYLLKEFTKSYDTYWRVIDCLYWFWMADIDEAKAYIATITYADCMGSIKKRTE